MLSRHAQDTNPFQTREHITHSTCTCLLITRTQKEGATQQILKLDGDVPWVVPPEISIPSEGRSDFANDTAQALALRDVEMDWYKRTGYRAMIYRNTSWDSSTDVRTGSGAVVFFGDVERHAVCVRRPVLYEAPFVRRSKICFDASKLTTQRDL